MMQCLTNIVGVTTSDCQCITAGLTSDEIDALAISTSGLFLDDLPGGVHLKAVRFTDACKNMAQMALGARDKALKTLEDDMVVALNTRYRKDKKNFSGQIGRMSFAQSLQVLKPLQGVRIRPSQYSDGLVTLSRMQIILNVAATVTVRIYRVPIDSVMGEEIATLPVTVAAPNAYTVVPLTGDIVVAGKIKLPLTYNGEEVEYYFLYDTAEPGNNPQPKDTAIQCSTCNSGISPFSDFVQVFGVQATDPTTLQDKLTDQYSHGLIMDVDIRCDNEKLFCGNYNENDAIAVTMAYAAYFKAGELLIEEVLKSPDVNRYTTMAREYLWGKRNYFRAQYDERIVYLTATINVSASNCYVCREASNQPFFSPIFS